MSIIGSSEESKQVERADGAGARTTEGSINHTGGHSMMRHMLLCGLGMVAALGIAAVLGVNVAPLFCAAMMVWMVWGMVAPTVRKLHHHDQAKQ